MPYEPLKTPFGNSAANLPSPTPTPPPIPEAAPAPNAPVEMSPPPGPDPFLQPDTPTPSPVPAPEQPAPPPGPDPFSEPATEYEASFGDPDIVKMADSSWGKGTWAVNPDGTFSIKKRKVGPTQVMSSPISPGAATPEEGFIGQETSKDEWVKYSKDESKRIAKYLDDIRPARVGAAIMTEATGAVAQTAAAVGGTAAGGPIVGAAAAGGVGALQQEVSDFYHWAFGIKNAPKRNRLIDAAIPALFTAGGATFKYLAEKQAGKMAYSQTAEGMAEKAAAQKIGQEGQDIGVGLFSQQKQPGNVRVVGAAQEAAEASPQMAVSAQAKQDAELAAARLNLPHVNQAVQRSDFSGLKVAEQLKTDIEDAIKLPRETAIEGSKKLYGMTPAAAGTNPTVTYTAGLKSEIEGIVKKSGELTPAVQKLITRIEEKEANGVVGIDDLNELRRMCSDNFSKSPDWRKAYRVIADAQDSATLRYYEAVNDKPMYDAMRAQMDRYHGIRGAIDDTVAVLSKDPTNTARYAIKVSDPVTTKNVMRVLEEADPNAADIVRGQWLNNLTEGRAETGVTAMRKGWNEAKASGQFMDALGLKPDQVAAVDKFINVSEAASKMRFTMQTVKDNPLANRIAHMAVSPKHAFLRTMLMKPMNVLSGNPPLDEFIKGKILERFPMDRATYLALRGGQYASGMGIPSVQVGRAAKAAGEAKELQAQMTEGQ